VRHLDAEHLAHALGPKRHAAGRHRLGVLVDAALGDGASAELGDELGGAVDDVGYRGDVAAALEAV
jgi:hypothetical protein